MLKQVALTFLVHLAVVVNADACPGDTNGDSQVNVPDLLNVLGDWGTDGSANGGDPSGGALSRPRREGENSAMLSCASVMYG